MSNSEELAALNAHIAELDGRINAMSMVLHASIIMTDDTLKRHREGIISLISDMAETTANPHTVKTLQEWIGLLRKA